MKFKKLIKQILKESPDFIVYKGKKTWEYYQDARPFGYYKGKFYTAPYSTQHHRIKELDPLQIGREDMTMVGRLWLDSKIITFWDYPVNLTQFKKVAKDIKKQLKVNIFDKNWKIEIPSDTNNKFIDTKEYIGSYKRKDISKQHTLPPIKKTKKKVPAGVGSKKLKKKYWEGVIKDLVKEHLEQIT